MLLLILILMTTQALSKQHKKSTNITMVKYSLKVGDTLPSIAKRYNTTVAKIVEINKLDISQRLKPSRTIKIPTDIYKIHQIKGIDKKGMDPNSKCIAHRVKRGDTLLALAKRAHTTVADIERVNRFSAKRKKLRIDETIIVPVYTKKREYTNKRAKLNKKIVSTEKIASHPHSKIKYSRLIKKIFNREYTSKRAKPNRKIVSTKKIASHPHGKIKYSRLVKKIFNLEDEYRKKDDLSKSASQVELVVKFSKRTKKDPLKEGDIYTHLSLNSSPIDLSIAKRYLGKRYVWGANGPKTFDCSGFTKYVCNQSGISLPRTSINQSKVGKKVDRSSLKTGDLIFFDTSRRHRGYVNHVGIYLGDDKFIHASSGKKRVVIASLNKPFYKSRFKWGRRLTTPSHSRHSYLEMHANHTTTNKSKAI